MCPMQQGPFPEPRLGLFWFVPDRNGRATFLSLSRPWSEVPEIGGFKTLDEGHVDVWPRLQVRHAFLRGAPYERFPRGRVNWRASDGAWLLLLDPKLRATAFVSAIADEWRLPSGSLLILTDPHYRSRGGPGLLDDGQAMPMGYGP